MPELTLLCDRLPSPASNHWYNSSVKSICGSAEQMQSTAANSIEAVIANVSDSVNGLQIQSSNVMQQTGRQPPILEKLYEPVTATNNGGANSVNQCCQHCVRCQTKLSSDEQNTPYDDKRGGNEKGSYNVTYAMDNFVHSSAPANVSVESSVVPGIIENGMSSPGVCARSLRIPNVSVSSAERVSMHCHPALSMEPLSAAELLLQPSVAHGGSRHEVESVHLPTSATSSYCPPSHSGQPVTSGWRQSGQFGHHPLPRGPRFVQASHQHRAPYESPQALEAIGQLTSQHPVLPGRFLSPASQQTSHAGARQPCRISPTHSSRLPLTVKCKSPAYEDDGQCCVSHVSPPAGAKVMQYTKLHQPSPMMPVANQHDELPGSSKAVRFTSQPGTALVGPAVQCNASICQQAVLYDSGRGDSQSSSALMNDSQHSERRVDLQQLPVHSLTPVVTVATTSCPRTVNDLLRTVQIPSADRSEILPKDFVTVDDFVESVLGHSSAATDSGLQVNDSAGSVDMNTPLVTSLPSLAVDNCNNVLHDVGDSLAHSDNGSSRQPLYAKKCKKVGVASDTHANLEYFQDKIKVNETTEQFSSGNNCVKLCSVAVNTSLYWSPADVRSNQSNVASSSASPLHNDAQCLKRFNSFDASCNDNTAQAAIDMAIRRNSGFARDADSANAAVSQGLYLGDRDVELVSDACDSTADISLRTPPPPVFPSPSEESVVSEMIMDMPEYTALSQEK